jgi:hypothetical protein
MIELISEPDVLDEDSIQKIVNLAHFPNFKIKEEVGNIMIILSEELDDQSSLLEVQKFNLHKIENNED